MDKEHEAAEKKSWWDIILAHRKNFVVSTEFNE